MAEQTQIVFTHKEVVEALVKSQGIHGGIWGLFVKFGFKAANVGATPLDINPAVIIPILEIGLQKSPEENNISVDAAKVNPKDATRPSQPPPRSKSHRERKTAPQ